MAQSDIINYFLKNGNKPVHFEEIAVPHISVPAIKRSLYKLTKHNEVLITYPAGRFQRPKYNLADRVVKSILNGR